MISFRRILKIFCANWKVINFAIHKTDKKKKGSPQSIIRFAEHVPNTDRNEHLVITGAKLYKYMQTELKFITRQNVS